MGIFSNLFSRKKVVKNELDKFIANPEKDRDLQAISMLLTNPQKEKVIEVIKKKLKTNMDIMLDNMSYNQDSSGYFSDLAHEFEKEKEYEIAMIFFIYSFEKSSDEWSSVVMEYIGDVNIKLGNKETALTDYYSSYEISKKEDFYRMRDLMTKIADLNKEFNNSDREFMSRKMAEEYNRKFKEEREKRASLPKDENDYLPF